MKVAIVGTGIAGLSAATALYGDHELTLFERSDWVGGHAHTVDVELDGERVAVDTGFVVCNRKTYPTFLSLLREHDVTLQETDMSFGVRVREAGVEYAAAEGDLAALFARPTNALRPGYYRMLRDVVRFYRMTRAMLPNIDAALTLGEFLRRHRFSREFIEWHILPMTAAVWSSGTGDARDFPLRTLVHFFENHGFLQLRDRPQWLTIRGGSRAYVQALSRPFASCIRLATEVHEVRRDAAGVTVLSSAGPERFDRIILANHAPDALALLADPSPLEREVLAAIPYTTSEVVLHSDERLMPDARRAWASWNYDAGPEGAGLPTVTYWMNRLHRLQTHTPLLVTLNGGARIDAAKVHGSFSYAHPLFSTAAMAAQRRHGEIDGQRYTHFCGAYWGYGFHEDGAKSGLRAAAAIEKERVRWAS